MQLVVLGLNHKTAPVEVRECFSFSEEQVKQALKYFRSCEGFSECVLLSTCNRTEVYAVVEDADEALAIMRQFLQKMAVNTPDARRYLFFFTGEDCINHLFRVASSLDSLIIGEGQILSQVKRAYSLARDADSTSTVLNTLFHRAIAVGKKSAHGDPYRLQRSIGQLCSRRNGKESFWRFTGVQCINCRCRTDE